VEVEIIMNVPGLPYRDAYRSWEHHTSYCGVCVEALRNALFAGSPAERSQMCAAGAELDQVLGNTIRWQHETSLDN
jgi:hypothetical protein